MVLSMAVYICFRWIKRILVHFFHKLLIVFDIFHILFKFHSILNTNSYCMCVSSRFHVFSVQSVSWILAEFYFSRGLQRLYTGTCIILQKTINGFLCLLIVFLKSKTYQLILKDVIKLNRNLR